MKKFKFLINKTEYLIGFGALLVWVILHFAGLIFGFEVYPVGYFQKLAFGILGTNIIIVIAWFWLQKTLPQLKNVLDPDNDEYKGLQLWERIKLGFWFFALFVISTVVLASLY
jgi:hypothetical protein